MFPLTTCCTNLKRQRTSSPCVPTVWQLRYLPEEVDLSPRPQGKTLVFVYQRVAACRRKTLHGVADRLRFYLAARGGTDVAASVETAAATQTSADAAPTATSNDSVATAGVGGRSALHGVADRLRFYLPVNNVFDCL
jgi:hypothetical protein